MSRSPPKRLKDQCTLRRLTQRKLGQRSKSIKRRWSSITRAMQTISKRVRRGSFRSPELNSIDKSIQIKNKVTWLAQMLNLRGPLMTLHLDTEEGIEINTAQFNQVREMEVSFLRCQMWESRETSKDLRTCHPHHSSQIEEGKKGNKFKTQGQVISSHQTQMPTGKESIQRWNSRSIRQLRIWRGIPRMAQLWATQEDKHLVRENWVIKRSEKWLRMKLVTLSTLLRGNREAAFVISNGQETMATDTIQRTVEKST